MSAKRDTWGTSWSPLGRDTWAGSWSPSTVAPVKVALYGPGKRRLRRDRVIKRHKETDIAMAIHLMSRD
jgi:hypothetical protein